MQQTEITRTPVMVCLSSQVLQRQHDGLETAVASMDLETTGNSLGSTALKTRARLLRKESRKQVDEANHLGASTAVSDTLSQENLNPMVCFWRTSAEDMVKPMMYVRLMSLFVIVPTPVGVGSRSPHRSSPCRIGVDQNYLVPDTSSRVDCLLMF